MGMMVGFGCWGKGERAGRIEISGDRASLGLAGGLGQEKAARSLWGTGRTLAEISTRGRYRD